jgi:site-specific DNA-methyltransferase (adenine-specific)
MGSGSTGVACMNTNRKFIGIEKEEKYFKIAEERIKEASNNLNKFME